MRIGVVRTQVPFVTGGAERHAANLVKAFNEYGHEAAEITLPFKGYPGRAIVDGIMAAKLTDLTEFEGTPLDMLVGLKFPAYLARHPNKVYWILHQHRQAYDLWESGHSDLPHIPDGPAIRDLIRAEDMQAFHGTPNPIYANSRNVAGRLLRHLGLKSRPLYHPPPNAERLRPGPYGDYLFAPSRLNFGKRQRLMLEALALTKGKVRIVFAGPPDSPAFLEGLKRDAARLGVTDRVEWLGAIDDATMIRRYADARAVVFVPIDEDYGYITLEAMLAAKPVVTVRDAGGPLEFIDDGQEGLIADPTPQALANQFDRIMEDRDFAEDMGQRGHAKFKAMNINWPHVVDVLTGKAQAAEDSGIERAAAAKPLALRVGKQPSAASAALAPDLPASDLQKIVERMAPPTPTRLPVRNIATLFGSYAFDTFPHEGADPTGAAAYFGTHWRRYLATLALIETKPPKKVLDVGTFPPFVFQALLKAAYPEVAMSGVWEGPQTFSQKVRSRNKALPGFEITLRPGNVERDRLPYDDESFDLVLGMEILEHFAIDPLHFFREAARVLEPGGRILLTTPNVVSHRGVAKALRGDAPYSFGIFVPTGGVYGRHNREYAPQEVRRLGEAAGFATEALMTADVYGDDLDPDVAALLSARGDDFALRGETILYVGRKGGEVRPLTDQLYHGDPAQLAARLTLLGHDKATGLARLRAENTARARWPAEGARAACLYLEWSDEWGDLVHVGGQIPLEAPVAPGEAREIALPLDPGGADGSKGTVSVEMFQAGVGRFAGAGRANVLRLPCSEAAFLRLVRARR